MSQHLTNPVRPTRVCLSQLGITVGAGVPGVQTPLSSIDEPIIKRAQKLPEELAANAADRVLCLKDRLWWKVRHGERWRGAGTRLDDNELRARTQTLDPPGRWWLGAAGWREAGAADDFYDELERAAKAEGKGAPDGKPKQTSRWLMPVDWDWRRMELEAFAAYEGMATRTVRHLIAESIRCGQTVVAQFEDYLLQATVRADGQDGAFLAITAEGIYDANVIATLLDAVPGVPHTDWLIEPDGVAGITPRSGQIIWSTLLTPQQTAELLALDDQEARDRHA
jgi:hypothetical protein